MIKKISLLTIVGVLYATVILAGTTSYQYDDLHRLTQVERSDGTITNYEYDSLGNRTSKAVTTNNTLSAQFMASPTEGSAPLEVSFTDQTTGDIISWAWDFGDGGLSSVQNPTHTYNGAGIYSVSLTVTNDHGSDVETQTDYITVSNGPPLVAEFSVNPTTGSAPLQVSFTDQSDGEITSWNWDFGDGESSSVQHPTHTYDDPGTYSVSLTISNTESSDTETRTDLITCSNSETDKDGDGVDDTQDNCPDVHNSNQYDADGDGTGNLCDATHGVQRGDLDGSGMIDLSDVILSLQLACGIEISTPFYLNSDINGDNKISLEESIYALQVVAGERTVGTTQPLIITFEPNDVVPVWNSNSNKWYHYFKYRVHNPNDFPVEVVAWGDFNECLSNIEECSFDPLQFKDRLTSCGEGNLYVPANGYSCDNYWWNTDYVDNGDVIGKYAIWYKEQTGNVQVGISEMLTLRPFDDNYSPWPCFRHDLKHTAQSLYKGPQKPFMKWKFQTGDDLSSPAIGLDGTIYIGSDDHYLYAINSDGSLKWRYSADSTAIRSSPAIGKDGTIYVGCGDGFKYYGYLYAINSDGTEKWKYQIKGDVKSSPVIGNNETIYFGTTDNCLYAITMAGDFYWKYETDGDIDSSPAIGSDGTLYVGSDDHYLYAIDQDGSLKWRYETGGAIDSSPAIGADGTIYVGSDDHYLYAINEDGSIKWRFEADHWINTSPAIGLDGTIYVGSDDNYLYAITQEGIEKWKFETIFNDVYSPSLGIDGIIYFGSGNNSVYALNPDGSLKWEYQTEGHVESTPAIGRDGVLYIGSDDNHLYAIGDSL